MLEKMNLLGAIVAITFFVSASLVFISRLLGKPEYGHRIGYFEFLLAIPLLYLLLTAPQLQRPPLYYIQIGCMLAWLVVEALLDYILKIEFRQVRWMVISYVILSSVVCERGGIEPGVVRRTHWLYPARHLRRGVAVRDKWPVVSNPSPLTTG